MKFSRSSKSRTQSYSGSLQLMTSWKSSKGGYGGSTDSSTRSPSKAKRPEASVKLWRIAFVFFLMALAGGFGYLTYDMLTDAETRTAEEEYDSTTNNALLTARKYVLRKATGGTAAMAEAFKGTNPDAATWPNISMTNFDAIAEMIVLDLANQLMSVLPIVTPETQAGFEAHAAALYDAAGYPPYLYEFLTGNEGIYNDNQDFSSIVPADGSTLLGDSPYKIMTPVFLDTNLDNMIRMLNLHYYPGISHAQDRIIECSERKKNGSYTGNCGDFSSVFQFRTCGLCDPFPGTYLQIPVYPVNDPSELVGFVGSAVVFRDIIEESFTADVEGFEAVICNDVGECYTFAMDNGVAEVFESAGDYHEAKYDKYRKTISLTAEVEDQGLDPNPEFYGGNLFSNVSTQYTLEIYPTERYFDQYKTNTPLAASFGAVGIMLITSLFFFGYDYFVRKEFKAKKAVLSAKRQFMRFISHEVRTPMNTVCMGLSLLMEEMLAHTRNITNKIAFFAEDKGKVDTTEWIGLVEETLSNAQQAVGVLNDLLNYDKIESGSLSLERTVFSMWALIDATSKEFRLQAQKKKIDLSVDFASLHAKNFFPGADEFDNDLSKPSSSKGQIVEVKDINRTLAELKVVGDIVRVTQVLRNLISNALKFTPEGGKVWITVSFIDDPDSSVETIVTANKDELIGTKSGFVQISVSDTGAGLTPDQVTKLFGEGVQFNVNKLQSGNGSGLGLYIAKGIMSQHGGSLSVASAGLDKGTTFTMNMPLYDVQESEESKTRTPSATAADGSLQAYYSDDVEAEACSAKRLPQDRPLRLLVVDDSVSNRKLLRRILQLRTHICDEANDGQEAVDMFMKAEMSQDPYDAILMDNEMPKMNGPTAAREIRSLGCQYLIVGITGNVLPEDVEQYISMGANCVLPKPLSIADLENTFRNYVLRKNSQYTAAEIQKRREEYIRKLAATLPEAPDGTGPSRPSGNSESPSGSLATVHQYGPAHSEEDGQGPAVGSATPFIGTGSSETIVNQCPRELPNASKGASLIMSSVSFRGRNSRVHSSSEDGFAALDVTPTDEFP